MLPTQHGLRDETARRMLDYVRAATFRARGGRHDFRIPLIVADEWSREGYCVLSTNRLAQQFGSTRRTMCKAIRRLLEAGIIKEVGRTADNRAKYVPCLEIVEQWRAAREARANGRH